MSYVTYEVELNTVSGLDDKVLFTVPESPFKGIYGAPAHWFEAPRKKGQRRYVLIDPLKSTGTKLEIRPYATDLTTAAANARRDVRLGLLEDVRDARVTDTLDARGKRYGDFEKGSVIAVNLKNVLRRAENYQKLDAAHKQALDIIMDKVSRILNGDPNYTDNWHDIAGYATLGEKACKPTGA